ncbi:hypothetical protein GCM10027059_42390 [Myceligenerans halotolerans]
MPQATPEVTGPPLPTVSVSGGTSASSGRSTFYAGNSNGFDTGQKAALDRLGITRVRSREGFHAEEELLEEVPDLVRVGTYKRFPCGPDEHNCALQLAERGVKVDQ